MEQQKLNGELVVKKEIIKSISYDQEEIMKNIIELYCQEGFELDPTYSIGNFYKNLPKPKYRYDINPQVEGVEKADCTDLPLSENSIKSIMFDPPFIASIPKKEATGIMNQRFGYYRNIQHELWDMYHKALREFYRILKKDGILVFKCQDCIDSCKQYFSHVEIINYAVSLGFYPKDLFVLLAKNRVIGKTHHNQQHARKFHCYFLVFVKQNNPIRYSSPTSQTKSSNEDCPTEPIICVKEDLLRKSPNSLTRTFLNTNIIGNFKNPLVSREQLNKQGAIE